jgi:hypothetical protein
MSRRSVVLAVLAWVAVVAAASGVTWAVINAAGQQVLAGGELPSQVQVPPSAPAKPTAPAPAPAPSQQRTRTWEGSAGSVTVRCSGRGASLQSASPDDGYGVEVGSRGPGEVEVTFKGGGGEVQVKGTCAAGTPRFSTQGRGPTGGDD